MLSTQHVQTHQRGERVRLEHPLPFLGRAFESDVHRGGRREHQAVLRVARPRPPFDVRAAGGRLAPLATEHPRCVGLDLAEREHRIGEDGDRILTLLARFRGVHREQVGDPRVELEQRASHGLLGHARADELGGRGRVPTHRPRVEGITHRDSEGDIVRADGVQVEGRPVGQRLRAGGRQQALLIHQRSGEAGRGRLRPAVHVHVHGRGRLPLGDLHLGDGGELGSRRRRALRATASAALLAAQGAVGVHLALGDGAVVVAVEATELH